MPNNQIWVTRKGREWQVSRVGGEALATAKTQREAIAIGRSTAQAEGAELIWQSTDGKIQGRNSYGNDPRRHKG